MDSYPYSISALFERKLRFIVPIFQRHYVWEEKKQWAPLWDDIKIKTVGRIKGQKPHPHFLGSLVLANGRVPTNTQTIPAFTVIDGQQRLTTMQLVLAAMRQVCLRQSHDNLAADIESLMFNLYRNAVADDERVKLRPTRFDRETYDDVMKLPFQDFKNKYAVYNTRGYKQDRKQKMKQNHVLGAYLYFYDAISDYLPGAEKEHSLTANEILDHLWHALTSDMMIIEITLGEKDDPQMIFENLNGRGTPLSQADLIRNYIFMRADKHEIDLDNLYEKYWSQLETDFWSEQVKQGRITDERFVFFFYNYLVYKTGQEVRFDKIFTAYKDWIIHGTPFPEVLDEVEDIIRASAIYTTLTTSTGNSALDRFARRLRRWDLTAIYPLLLLIELSDTSESERQTMYSDLESYLVRRMVCGKTQKNYNKSFISLLSKLRETGINSANLRAILLSYTAETNVWPTDAEFEKAWLEAPVYHDLGAPAVNVILQELEAASQGRFNENVTINSALSIEHVMPQAWHMHWPLNGKKISEEDQQKAGYLHYAEEEADGHYTLIDRRNDLSNSFGNLTLLTQPLNSSYGNADFTVKRPEILKQSALALNRYFQSVNDWDESTITQRGVHLFALARSIWAIQAADEKETRAA